VLIALAPAVSSGRELEGIPAGRWLLSPWLNTAFGYQSNVLLEHDASDDTDRVAGVEGGLMAQLPFRNSRLDLGYTAGQLLYSEKDFPRNTSQKGEIELELRFRTTDKLTFGDTYREDFARVRSPATEGGESFVGEPYTVNRWDVELRRDAPTRPGYVVRVRRIDFVYDGETPIGFFDYRGFQYHFEYRQPLPSGKQWHLTYAPRRFKHYYSDSENHPDFPVGVEFRTETSDSLLTGVSGSFGDDQPYRIAVGWGRSTYDNFDTGLVSKFSGVVGSAAWWINIGGRSGVELSFSRRPLPSNFSSYYIYNNLRADFSRE